MIISYQGRDYEFDPEQVTVDEWRELKRKYRMTPKAYEDGINEADPDASTFTYWIMLRRSGQQGQSLGDHLKPDILELNAAIAAAKAAEDEAAQEAEQAAPAVDPTSPPLSPAASASPPAAPAQPSAPWDEAVPSTVS